MPGTEFLSTPSARRATRPFDDLQDLRDISIHALREEGDAAVTAVGSMLVEDFYPRPPRGGRPFIDNDTVDAMIFLSTPSARRATSRSSFRSRPAAYFYPRPPRGGRPITRPWPAAAFRFLSTPSARRATCSRRPADPWWPISIHALREEGDQSPSSAAQWTTYFYPRPPRGGRLSGIQIGIYSTVFLSTPSARRATRRTECRYHL